MPPSWSEQLVLVTGGAGFIGSHLADALAAAGARVRVLDDFSSGSRENLSGLGERVEVVEGDIRDAATCQHVARDVAVIFHQAALGSVPRSLDDPASTFAVNVAGSANVFAAARDAGVRRVVYASSSSIYGDSGSDAKREDGAARPRSPYAVSKQMTEQLAASFRDSFGLDLIGLRYFNVYGPRQDPEGPYAAVIPRFVTACAQGRPPIIYGDGEQTRDFTFVADAVRANLLAAEAPDALAGEVFNVAGGNAVSVAALARHVAELTGCGATPVHEPPRAGDVLHSVGDPAKAARGLGLTDLTPLSEGLALTVESA